MRWIRQLICKYRRRRAEDALVRLFVDGPFVKTGRGWRIAPAWHQWRRYSRRP